MELYGTDLQAILKLMAFLPEMAKIDTVFELEIRARIDDADEWVVLGYGESGDPCVLRFEKTKPEPVLPPFPHPIGPGIRGPWVGQQPLGTARTINKASELSDSMEYPANDKVCSCGDYSYNSYSGGACGPNGCYNRPA